MLQFPHLFKVVVGYSGKLTSWIHFFPFIKWGGRSACHCYEEERHSVCNVLSNLPGTWCALNKYEFGARSDESSPRVRLSRLVQSMLRGSVLSCFLAAWLLFSHSEGFPLGFCEP